MAQRDFAQKQLPGDPLFKLVSLFYEVVPPVLQAGGKVRITALCTLDLRPRSTAIQVA